MRLRLAVFTAAVAALAAMLVPGLANAAPRHNHGLTINATPNPIITGDAVLIYGRLGGANPSGQRIVLYHRINPAPNFTVVSTTKTNSEGFYWFTRAEGVVLTNRNWFVRAPGLPGVHSRTVHERVAAALSIAASVGSGDTGHPITFTGHVDPAGLHVGERVYLQQVNVSNGHWQTLKSGVIGAGSTYSISYTFRTPGAHDVRVLFTGDNRNIGAPSASVNVAIQQAQNPAFTINTSAPVIGEGSSATISGVLYLSSTNTPDPNVAVRLFARPASGGNATAAGDTTTGPDGSYSFEVSPDNNTDYYVRTTFAPPAYRRTAALFEGVADAVTLQSSATSRPVGERITLSGIVVPDKSGHLIELQRLGKDGAYHTVAVTVINNASAYTFLWRFGNVGTFTFRTHVAADQQNVGGNSPPLAINVTLPPVAALPNT
jgi:hypothetical protein